MIWVDSICINQDRHNPQAKQERDIQIALMGEIYTKAMQVNAYLGPGNSSSDAAALIIRRLTAAIGKVVVARSIGIREREALEHYDRVAEEALATSPEFPFGKLQGLFCLPWFRRVWVFQEVVLAKKVVFYCGEHLVRFENIAAAADFTLIPYSKLDAPALYWSNFLGAHRSMALSVQRRDRGENPGVDLLQFLAITSMLEATEPQDHVNGLYACAKRVGVDMPAPDHTKSVAQVFTDTAIACLRQSGTLQLLTQVEGAGSAEFDLPSWVPNLTGHMGKWNSASPPKISRPLQWDDMGSKKQVEWVFLPETKQLKVLGRRLDRVVAVSEPWMADASTTLLGNAALPSGQIISSLLDCFASWVEIAQQRIRERNQNAISANDMLAVTDLARLFTNGRKATAGPNDLFSDHRPPSQLVKYLSLLAVHSWASDADVRSNLIHPDDDPSTWMHLGDITLSQPMSQVLHYLVPWTWRSVFRTTSKAYLGLCGYSVKPGDELVILRGMTVPCLVRPCAQGHNYVSAAYVDGFVESEFWDAGSDADNEWFHLT
ncbi:hypothetical protein E8E12_010891 [Didymella heteroderae]|uniref:Heterokaryon incompatibility domain-containing protein n=1 Tax=Didymella heteroderae TaxID=1769908 RepID=A0A9P4X011_9PLEO|nr:hypothetical protein E8E12_010891 [Didymella heteroderae]